MSKHLYLFAATVLAAGVWLQTAPAAADYGRAQFGKTEQTAGTSRRAHDPKVPADNTGVNKRDADQNSITPVDQSNEADKLETTRKIRQAVTDDKSLSTYAHNVKIITADDGVIHLRGPVRSTEEKHKIEKIARQYNGGLTVQSDISVAPEKK